MKKNFTKLKQVTFICLAIFLMQNNIKAQYFWQVSSIISFTGGATYSQGSTANPLVLSLQQCAGGISQPHNSTIYNRTVYANTVNSTTGGTVVASNAVNTPFVFTTTYSYTPSTSVIGTLYYYILLTSPSMTTCGFTGTLTSSIQTVVVTAPPVPGEALNFDASGSPDNVVLPSAISSSSLVGGNKVSVEAWVRPTSLTGLGVIAGNYSTPAGSLQFLLRRDNNTYVAFIGTGVGGVFNGIGSSPGTCTLNIWQHVALSYNGSVLSLYINGILTNTASMAHVFAATTNSIILGANNINENFTGDIDEVRIWNVGRTQCEINTYKNCEIPASSTGLIANYHFNQGAVAAANTTVTTLTDASGNSFDGTLNTFALTGTTSNWTAPGGVVSGYTTTLAPPTIAVNSGAICAGKSFTMVPSGATTYTFSNGSAVATPTANASYSVTGTSSLGCISSSPAVSNVTVNSLPAISVNSGAICTGNSFTMVPSGASTYTFSNGSSVATPTTNASYSVTGTSTAGCVSSTPAVSNVTVNSLPAISVNSGAICTGKSFTMVPSGATSYTFSNGSAVATPTANASYSVTGTSTAGCVSSTPAVSNVTVNSNPTVTAVSNSSLICTGQTVSLTASGAVTYTWSTNATGANTTDTPTMSTTYTVTGASVNGCTNSATVFQNVSACTDVKSVNNSISQIEMYPNPTTGMVTIKLNSNAQIIIMNTVGQVIANELMTEGKRDFDITHFANGIYFVKVISNGNQQTFKLIKE